MSLDRDMAVDISAAKTIMLGGEKFYIAPLPLRQILAIADLLPKLRDIKVEGLAGDMFMPVVDMVRRGLLKAYPNVTCDDILDKHVSLEDLLAMVPVITEQSGAKKPEVDAGEA